MADVAECGFKQCAIIYFLKTEAPSGKEISNTWITVYRDNVHSFPTTDQWVVQFKNRSEITDKRGSGRPFSASKPDEPIALLTKTFYFKSRNNNATRY